MSMRGVLFGLMVMFVACTQPVSSTKGDLIGALDLVLVDELGEGLLAGKEVDGDGFLAFTGMPSRFLFLTSTETNELRLLENYRDGQLSRGYVRAPNPLEPLSIPVLDRPTILVTDEGRNSKGERVTGSYVYASRAGAAEISVVSISKRRQLGGKPMATPAPVISLSAHMEVDQNASVLQTALPATTRLFVATWDGEHSAVYSATLATNSPDIEQLDFEQVLALDDSPIVSLTIVPPFAQRNVDGMAFCATTACLAVATRADAGRSGESFLFEPSTGRSYRFGFAGPVRLLVNSASFARVYGLLDEAVCGGPQCGGVVAVDLSVGTAADGFPASKDALGQPMAPMRSSGLITGLTLARGASIQQTGETAIEGQAPTLVSTLQPYQELGAYAASNGVLTFFTGLGGSIIDFDGRRGTVSSANINVPGSLADGGTSFVSEDGGAFGSSTALEVSVNVDLSQTYRVATVVNPDGGTWTLDISDGYLSTQSLVIINQGQIPGLVSVPTTAADGTRVLVTGGFESRALIGDSLRFESGNETDGYKECGRTFISAIETGALEVGQIPTGCENRVRASVRAQGNKPLVAVAEVDGYLGRWAASETLIYNRPYLLLTAGVTQPRTALTIQIPSEIPPGEGAYVSFQIEGHLAPYQALLDTSELSACRPALFGQVVWGNLVMAEAPASVTAQAAVGFRWTLFGLNTSGNGMADVDLTQARLGTLSSANGTICWP